MISTSKTTMLSWLEQNVGKTYGNFINGKWINSNSGKIYPIYHAANKSQILSFFQNSTKEDVDSAVEAANTSFKSWSKVPGPDRGAILYRFADLLEQQAEELSYMLSAEQGKSLGESRGEVLRAAKEARFCAGEAFRIEGETLPGERSGVNGSTIRQPIGVIAAIAPWNFPVVTPVRKIAPALAYGCTVVYKPASATPWTSVRIMELLNEAGVPKGVVNLVVGNGSSVGTPLVEHPLVKGISFTGSTKLGVQINELAARKLAKTQLELGGKNPAVVLDYENPNDVAKQIVAAAFACSGQRCTSISRVIVVKEKKEELTEALIKEMMQIKVGPAWEKDITMGPLVNQQQLDSVQDYLKIGLKEGARLRFGGKVLTEDIYGEGAYMQPTLLDQVTPQMRVAQEEIFGPILCVIEADTQEEAFDIANSINYGLAASVFTTKFSAAHTFAEEAEVGMVHVNHGTASAAHMPFGGWKQSGFGAYSIGKSNSEFYTNVKAIYYQY
ncbi:aldehyde dehydrogenase family protein [Metabacillus litoralis]|uniref:aldehyde dehydrogenase family protein n=1 Tax=Metabacillus litoralis TaxID=152268 RepID=UPI00203ACC8E|nr:aldehyde dehydrogenase family protein [Metabacillus litoralis]MCM3408655.1 aldehyde dehydrogenase family protein [Metabacillus litoralis]